MEKPDINMLEKSNFLKFLISNKIKFLLWAVIPTFIVAVFVFSLPTQYVGFATLQVGKIFQLEKETFIESPTSLYSKLKSDHKLKFGGNTSNPRITKVVHDPANPGMISFFSLGDSPESAVEVIRTQKNLIIESQQDAYAHIVSGKRQLVESAKETFESLMKRKKVLDQKISKVGNKNSDTYYILNGEFSRVSEGLVKSEELISQLSYDLELIKKYKTKILGDVEVKEKFKNFNKVIFLLTFFVVLYFIVAIFLFLKQILFLQLDQE